MNNEVPQSIWYKFHSPMLVRRFSFKSRNGSYTTTVSDGPTKYSFFGSNGPDCSDNSTYVILFEDHPGTPFTIENIPKIGDISNPREFLCFGFKVFDTDGRSGKMEFVAMSEIRFYF